MVHIITPRGVLREVKRAFTVCEMRVQFNGKNQRFAEPTIDLNEATGIMFEAECLAGDMMNGGKLIVGNLKTEKVREIMESMLTNGFYDLSSLKYQGWVRDSEETVFDNARSLPYTSDFVENGYSLMVNMIDDLMSCYNICKSQKADKSTADENEGGCDECEEGADESDGVPGGAKEGDKAEE